MVITVTSKVPPVMNEAETRAEHIDPALTAAGWGVVEGSRILREYPITPGRIEGLGRRGKALIADYVLVYRNRKLAVVEPKAWAKPLTEGVGQAKDYAGKMAVRFAYATNGQGIYAIDMETGQEGEIAAYPPPDQLWAKTFPSTAATASTGSATERAGRTVARPFRRCAIRGQGRLESQPLLPGHRRRAGDAGHRGEQAAHPAYLGHRHGQDVHCISDCVETVSRPLELERPVDASSPHPVPRRPEHPGESGLQRFLRLPRRRAGAHFPG